MEDLLLNIVFLSINAYTLLGIVHVLTALIRYFFTKEKYEGYHDRIGKYLLSVVAYFGVLGILFLIENYTSFSFGEYFWVAYLFIIPWPLAIYYWNTVFFLEKKMNRIANTENLHLKS